MTALFFWQLILSNGLFCLLASSALFAQDQIPPAVYDQVTASIQQGKGSEAEQALRAALRRFPREARALSLLGVTLDSQKRYEEAERYYAQALEIAPSSAALQNNLGNHYLARGMPDLIHYSRALRKLGRRQEAEALLIRFKQTGPDRGARARAGLFDYFKLSPAEQQAQYLANLERSARADPKDAHLKLRLAKALVSQNKEVEALDVFREIRALTTDALVLANCGKALLEYGPYSLAREFLEPAVEADPSVGEPRLDLAIAVFHTAGPGEGLLVLDKMPAGQRQGDYYLLRAQILDASGQFKEAAQALNRGILSSPTRPDLYHQASLFLIKHERYDESLALLQQAIKVLPNASPVQGLLFTVHAPGKPPP